MSGPAYIDSFRLIRILPDDVTIAADAVDDTLTLVAGPGISLVANTNADQLTIVNTNPAEFSLGVAGDDSSIKTISSGETIRFAGAQNITVTADSEGAITITGPDLSSYLTAETDPVFSASDVAGVTTSDISNWDEAYSWGDHAVAGYLTSIPNDVTIGSVRISTNVIQTVDSNADLELEASGTGAVSVAGNLKVSGNISINNSGGIGYTTGVGGAVTQTSNRGNGVALNKITGEITLVSDTIAAGDLDAFFCGNNLIEATDVVYAQVSSYNPGVYLVVPQAVTSPFPGIFFYLRNIDSFASPTEVVTIRYIILKSTNS